MNYLPKLLIFFVLIVPSLWSMNHKIELIDSVLIIAKGDKRVQTSRAWLTQEVANKLQDEHVRQWFKNISHELVLTVVKFCNFVRMESKVNTQSGLTKLAVLNISFEDMPEFLKALIVLSLQQQVITDAIRYYVEKAKKRKIYLNNYQFYADPVKDSDIKLEIDKWYFLKYGSHLDIPQGTFPLISIQDLLEAGKKITATTVGKMIGKLAKIEIYCQLDDIVILLNDFALTSLDGINDLLVQLGVAKDKIVVIDLRGHKLKVVLDLLDDEDSVTLCLEGLGSFADYKALKLVYLDTDPLQLNRIL